MMLLHFLDGQSRSDHRRPWNKPAVSKQKSRMIRKPPLLPIASSVLDTLQLDMATILQSNFPQSSSSGGGNAAFFDFNASSSVNNPERMANTMQHNQQINNICPPVKGWYRPPLAPRPQVPSLNLSEAKKEAQECLVADKVGNNRKLKDKSNICVSLQDLPDSSIGDLSLDPVSLSDMTLEEGPLSLTDDDCPLVPKDASSCSCPLESNRGVPVGQNSVPGTTSSSSCSSSKTSKGSSTSASSSSISSPSSESSSTNEVSVLAMDFKGSI